MSHFLYRFLDMAFMTTFLKTLSFLCSLLEGSSSPSIWFCQTPTENIHIETVWVGENADMSINHCILIKFCAIGIFQSPFFTGRYLKIIEGNATFGDTFRPVCIIKAICGTDALSVREKLSLILERL